MKHKIESAIRILRIAEKQAEQYAEPVEIAYSGGKDSDVLLQLARESGINYRAIYKNTTIDPKGTIQHVRENAVEIMQPKRSFFDIIKSKGYPSMFFRFCCSELKEYKILSVCCVGVRAEESNKRKERYKTFEKCRVYSKSEKVHQYAPLYDWTLQDVKDYLTTRNVKLAPVYYNPDGTIDFTRRLGCMGCPLQSDHGKATFKNNPALLRAWIRSGQIYLNTHTHTRTYKMFNGDAYGMFLNAVFCQQKGEYQFKMSKNLFGDPLSPREYLENYFKVKL